MSSAEELSVSTRLAAVIRQAIASEGGWIGFDRYMAMALYEPGLGYYANGRRTFGRLPTSGSDFVTAPELTPRFGQALARQLAQWRDAGAADTVWEFGAGSGALAEQLLDALAAAGRPPSRYVIVELSAALRERQRARLARFGAGVDWVAELPARIEGVVVGNEVLDAMPVQLLHWDGQRWHERGVAADGDGRFRFADRPTDRRPPVDAPFVAGTVTETHEQARAFVATVCERLHRGALLLLDYGFPEREYYHPQRTGGTVMCHRAHRSDADPLADVGLKDITAHVDFTGIALAGQDAGADVLGYTTQGRFLLNCGILEGLAPDDHRARAAVHTLVGEHEMGELFKVIAFGRDLSPVDPIGFVAGDRMHRL